MTYQQRQSKKKNANAQTKVKCIKTPNQQHRCSCRPQIDASCSLRQSELHTSTQSAPIAPCATLTCEWRRFERAWAGGRTDGRTGGRISTCREAAVATPPTSQFTPDASRLVQRLNSCGCTPPPLMSPLRSGRPPPPPPPSVAFSFLRHRPPPPPHPELLRQAAPSQQWLRPVLPTV